jgi:hypothetical protein
MLGNPKWDYGGNSETSSGFGNTATRHKGKTIGLTEGKERNRNRKSRRGRVEGGMIGRVDDWSDAFGRGSVCDGRESRF